MQISKERTQEEIDSEIPHDHDHETPPESLETSPAAPEETTDSALQAESPLIGDCDTAGTTLKPIC